ncbi:hypothetical protein D3C87_406410 [compost metagenome]
MIYLKIDDNKGFFLREDENRETTWHEIDLITKEDLYFLLKRAVAEDFEMVEYNEQILANKAHQIIYKNLFEKFVDLVANRTRFRDESENLYKAALDKYKQVDNQA